MPVPRPKIRDAEHCEGGPQAVLALAEWLRPLIKTGGENEEELTAVLHETSKGALGREVDTYVIELDSALLDAKVEEIVSDAEHDALKLRGRIKYTLKIEGRRGGCLFTIDAPTPVDDEDEDDDDDLDNLETPTKRGMVQQAQRFAENSHKEMRLAAKASRELVSDLRLQLKESRDENRELRTAVRDGLRLEQELHNMDHARRLNWMKQEKSEQRKEQFLGVLKQIGPPILASVLGADPRLLGAMMQGPPPVQQQQQAPGQPDAAALNRESRTPIEAAAERVVARLTRLDERRLGQLMNFFEQDEFADIMTLHQLVVERLAKEQTTGGGPKSQNGSAPRANGNSAYGGSA